VDWNLSRSRYWGTPLPIWRTEDGQEEKCIGSIAELNAEIKKAAETLGGDINTHYLHDGILDLHKPYVDEVVLVSDSGKPMRREPDLIDVWFDSGAMPYAQWGLPPAPSGGGGADVTPEQVATWVMFNEGKLSRADYEAFIKEQVTKSAASTTSSPHPGGPGGADFIAEGVDQTRGWFYTLHALGVMLFDNVAYKTVVSNGLVLDKNGAKMSKRCGQRGGSVQNNRAVRRRCHSVVPCHKCFALGQPEVSTWKASRKCSASFSAPYIIRTSFLPCMPM
jgi:isoleucyl-tRNA synthetase